MSQSRKPSDSFFIRESDGSVRIRLRFGDELASTIEEAAGTKPLMKWILSTLDEGARREVAEARRQGPKIPPPNESDGSQ